MKHIYAICAYKESPYLKDCIDSVKAQGDIAEILLCTATPSEHLAEIARKEGLVYCVNADKPNIAGDWNFALAQAKGRGADYATLCHQDDLYLPGYGEAFQRAIKKDPDLTIWFSDYGEQRGERAVMTSTLLKIKRILLLPVRLPLTQTWRWCKRLTLAFGSSICCPAVTFNLRRIGLPLFERGMTTNLDWQTWEKLSLLPGRFAYDPGRLMLHRIHRESTTSKVLGEGGRRAQDLAMFRKFWPEPLAKMLCSLYANSEKSNDL